jgi:predicted lipoprotein with Yx(FWY)xxD motif
MAMLTGIAEAASGLAGRARIRRFIVMSAAAVAAAGSVTAAAASAHAGPAAASGAGSAGVPAAGTASARPGTPAVVVLQRRRHGFGTMLVTISGRALYVLPRGSCAGQCLAVWPPLLLPAGVRTARGARCLATARFGTSRLQVIYRRLRLYTFVSDHGRSVDGNGVGGFAAARVVRCAPPVPSPGPSQSPSPTGSW